MKEIPLTLGKAAMVDDCDYDAVGRWEARGEHSRTWVGLWYPQNLRCVLRALIAVG